jgi:two-component system, OmpR family, sensor kinase
MAGQEVLSSHQKARPRPAGWPRRLSQRTPLRTKLITAVLGLVILALAAISIASVYMLRGYVTTQDDSLLGGALRGVNSGLDVPAAGYAAPFAQGSDLVIMTQEPGHQVTTWATPVGGTNFGGSRYREPLPELPTGTGWAGTVNATLLTVNAQSGPDSWRVIAETVNVPGSSETVVVLVAAPLGNLGALTQRLVLFDLIVGGAIVVVLAAVGVGVVQANLRPLNDIEMSAGQIARGHLEHRVPEGDPRTEIGSLGRSLNGMLTQIENAFHAQKESEQAAVRSEERMRRFVADASHELRTPLTTIRGFAAHYRQRGGAGARTDAAVTGGAAFSPGGADGLSPEELDHLMGRVEAEATRMGLLVEDLLTLARLDQQRPLAVAPVDLLTVAVDTVQDARIVSPGRPIDLIVAPGTAFLVEGDEPRLRQVLANLVNNALTHTPAGTPVRVKISRGTVETAAPAGPTGANNSGGWASGAGPGGTGPIPVMPPVGGRTVPAVVLDIEDDGPGMPPDQAQRVFERFYRADAARNRASGGTGLGLAIVAGLVAAHGGTVSVRTAPGQGADFQVKLPLSPDAVAPDDADDDLSV